jgi:hypothetical protein
MDVSVNYKLLNIDGSTLATWATFDWAPTYPPVFSLPNNDYRCPYVLQIDNRQVTLRTGISLHAALMEAIDAGT